MNRHFDHSAGQSGKRLAYLERKTAELERPAGRGARGTSHRRAGGRQPPEPGRSPGAAAAAGRRWAPDGLHAQAVFDLLPDLSPEYPPGLLGRAGRGGRPMGLRRPHRGHRRPRPGKRLPPRLLLGSQGGRSRGPGAATRHCPGDRRCPAAERPGRPAWPAVQREVARACQNPDVKSEPGQVNFACARATRQILWVFALLTSGDNPNFGDQDRPAAAWSRSPRRRAARWPGR